MTDPSKLTDADVETLRRAMVEAWQTWLALKECSPGDDRDAEGEVIGWARRASVAAASAYLAAKRARGGA